MKVVPYEEKYLSGVITCLRRNFDWMGEASEDEVINWITPVLSYRWSAESEVSTDEYAFKHGAVLLDNDKVVGYFGMIMSRRSINGSSYICGSPTTWAIDEGYRFFFYEALNTILDKDVKWFEYSPRKSVAEALKLLYGFKLIGQKQFRLVPVPTDNNECEVITVEDISVIEDEIILREYIDHKDLRGIRLAMIASNHSRDNSFLFYKTFDEDSTRIRILKISRPEVFANHCSEVIWKLYNNEFYPNSKSYDVIVKIMDGLYNKEKLCVECDDFLLNGNMLNHPLIKERAVTRLCRPAESEMTADLLYTESSLLSYRI